MQEVEPTNIHVPTTLNDDTSVASTITRSTVSVAASERRKMQLMEKYGTGKTMDYNKSTLQSFNRAVRKVLLPRMKFVSNSKSFATFEQPDFSDSNCWVHRVFDQLGALNNYSDSKKAEIWMTYRNKIKDQFSLHRSNVTTQLKTVFVKGKNYCMCYGDDVEFINHAAYLYILFITHIHVPH